MLPWKKTRTGCFGAKSLPLKDSKQLRDSILKSTSPRELIKSWRLNIDNEMSKGEEKNVQHIKQSMRLIRKTIKKLHPQQSREFINDTIEYLLHINRQLQD